MNNYCTNCGNKIDNNTSFCTNCGVKLRSEEQTAQVVNNDDKGGFGWGALGFFVPIAGLILYLVWKDSKPKNAKAAGKGALTFLIVYGVIIVIAFVLGFLFSFNGNVIGNWINDEFNEDYYEDYYDDRYYNFE